ncbi:MAG TPA: hypothetical protein VM938_10715 [Acidimicrobiales bacterium]|nr:hypothetical protein [Acidimicrobiales bacterium]
MAVINYEIPDDLHRRAKVVAAQRDTTLKQVLIDALQRYVEAEESPRKS